MKKRRFPEENPLEASSWTCARKLETELPSHALPRTFPVFKTQNFHDLCVISRNKNQTAATRLLNRACRAARAGPRSCERKHGIFHTKPHLSLSRDDAQRRVYRFLRERARFVPHAHRQWRTERGFLWVLRIATLERTEPFDDAAASSPPREMEASRPALERVVRPDRSSTEFAQPQELTRSFPVR